MLINQNEPTRLFLKGEAEIPIELIIRFNNSETNKSETLTNVINENTMEINFVNFNNSLGTYSSAIWDLGILKMRKLYFYYLVKELENTNLKQLVYSFYLGEEANNG